MTYKKPTAVVQSVFVMLSRSQLGGLCFGIRMAQIPINRRDTVLLQKGVAF